MTVKLPPWMPGGNTRTTTTTGSTAGPSPTASQTITTQAAADQAALPSGIVPLSFTEINVATGLTAQRLYRVVVTAASAIGVQMGAIALFRGSVVAIAVNASAAKTAGTATIEAYANGVALGAQLIWANTKANDYATFAAGTYVFAAGDVLDLRITTDGSFAPTTVDIEAILFISQTTSND